MMAIILNVRTKNPPLPFFLSPSLAANNTSCNMSLNVFLSVCITHAFQLLTARVLHEMAGLPKYTAGVHANHASDIQARQRASMHLALVASDAITVMSVTHSVCQWRVCTDA